MAIVENCQFVFFAFGATFLSVLARSRCDLNKCSAFGSAVGSSSRRCIYGFKRGCICDGHGTDSADDDDDDEDGKG